MLNFRYLFILFLFLSFNSYAVLTCTEEAYWYCDADSVVTVTNSFTDGIANAAIEWELGMQAVQEANVAWSLSASISFRNANTAAVQSAWSAASNAFTASTNAWIRANNTVFYQNSAVDAAEAAWQNNNIAIQSNLATTNSRNAAAASATAAAVSALLAATGADTITDGITSIVNEVNTSLNTLQTNALADVNNQIAGIVGNVETAQTQALIDIQEYIDNSLVDVDISDSTVVASALDTNTIALDNLVSAIANIDDSQGDIDNTALISALNDLSSSASDIVPSDGSDVVSAVESVGIGLETNTGVLDNLYSFFTDDDSSGEIDNKSTGAFNTLKTSIMGNSPSFSFSGVSCPTWAFDEGALIVGGLVIDSHCEIIKTVRPHFSAIMLTIFSILGFRTVFSA